MCAHNAMAGVTGHEGYNMLCRCACGVLLCCTSRVAVGDVFNGRGELDALGLHTQVLKGINHRCAERIYVCKKHAAATSTQGLEVA